MLGTPLIRDPGSELAYSNAGYLRLAQSSKKQRVANTGALCRQAVLSPAGAAGLLDPDWPILWSCGGWRVSCTDYLAFCEAFSAHSLVLGKRDINPPPRMSGVECTNRDVPSAGKEAANAYCVDPMWPQAPPPRCVST
jgi:hypothetical protein